MRKDPAVTEAFGATIRQLRLSKRMTQEQVCGVAQLDRSFLARVELGQVSPSIVTAFAIAKGLDVSFSQLSIMFEQNLRNSRNDRNASDQGA